MRVRAVVKYANMPTRRPTHTRTVNSTPGMWDTFHPIRFLWKAKGLSPPTSGHMAHIRARKPRGT